MVKKENQLCGKGKFLFSRYSCLSAELRGSPEPIASAANSSAWYSCFLEK